MIFSLIGIAIIAPHLGIKKIYERFFSPKHAVCMIVSDQENAEIYVNGIKTSRNTPCLVKIAKKGESKIVIKKMGYVDHVVYLKSHHELSFYYCQLKKFELKLLGPEAH